MRRIVLWLVAVRNWLRRPSVTRRCERAEYNGELPASMGEAEGLPTPVKVSRAFLFASAPAGWGRSRSVEPL